MGNYIIVSYGTNGKRSAKHYGNLHNANAEFDRIYYGQATLDPDKRNVRYVVLRRRDDGCKLRSAKLAGRRYK